MTTTLEPFIDAVQFILTEHDKNNPYFNLESRLKELIREMKRRDEEIADHVEELQERAQDLYDTINEAQTRVTYCREMQEQLRKKLCDMKEASATDLAMLVGMVTDQCDDLETVDYFLSK